MAKKDYFTVKVFTEGYAPFEFTVPVDAARKYLSGDAYSIGYREAQKKAAIEAIEAHGWKVSAFQIWD